ncbi:hypothetical protein ACNKHN_14815 [Shigella flexneri]
MAAAFHRAGFDAIDVHMSDSRAGRTAWRVSTPCSVRWFLPRRCAGARRGVGEPYPVQ